MRRLVLVDDEPDIVDALTALLELEGYTVVSAPDGEKALALITSDPPPVVITDLMMPHMTGADLMAALKEDPRFDDIRFIVVSAAGGEHVARTYGAHHFRKPLDIEALLAKLDELFRSAQAARDRSGVSRRT